MSDKPEFGRRNFLAAAVVGIGGLLSVLMGLPAILYVVEPALKKEESGGWLRIASTSKVPIGVPSLFSLVVEKQTGWITNQEEIMVYIYTEDGRNYAAMSNVCTHLACRVRWIDERQEFFCPCHNGVYDKQGKVLAGPPPRPLDRFEVNVENDEIFIKAG